MNNSSSPSKDFLIKILSFQAHDYSYAISYLILLIDDLSKNKNEDGNSETATIFSTYTLFPLKSHTHYS